MKISEVATLTGISVRTLHYYDEIGLLKPDALAENGYRVYTDAELETLQQILFFRELGFPLKDIQAIMENPDYDRQRALQNHKELLLQKRSHIDELLKLVEQSLKGEADMSFRQFDTSAFEAAREKYAAEAKERWGDTAAYAQFEEQTGDYDKSKWRRTDDGMAALLNEFGKHRTLDPADARAQELVKEWQAYISAHYYHCTDEILAGLGKMYVADARFTKNIDEYGAGTAAFLSAAIACYCADRK